MSLALLIGAVLLTVIGNIVALRFFLTNRGDILLEE
jgi:hypothetical protein